MKSYIEIITPGGEAIGRRGLREAIRGQGPDKRDPQSTRTPSAEEDTASERHPPYTGKPSLNPESATAKPQTSQTPELQEIMFAVPKPPDHSILFEPPEWTKTTLFLNYLNSSKS